VTAQADLSRVYIVSGFEAADCGEDVEGEVRRRGLVSIAGRTAHPPGIIAQDRDAVSGEMVRDHPEGFHPEELFIAV
jgi:hypothetical protein